ncbi:MAG: hypothetical protein B7X41_11850 [Microbacterium sp. 14-71-5]|jgi:EAL domain-containing protein (putative c-di-GMP-specific phosphodiesterase class I)|nr:MAG: hypothetical protein B7X41_11850 [Microbacterium sp. 14-71-5]
MMLPNSVIPTAGSGLTHIVDEQFDAIVDRREVSMVFQPVVNLRSGETVGLEALVRGPAGTPLESPHALFAAAARRGRTAELDWVCRAAAFEAVLDAEIPPAISLFINTEPESHAQACPPDLLATIARGESLLRVFVEVNDRALTSDPGGLLAAVDRARSAGWGIGIDDVGSSRASVAIVPVVGADVAKLDLQLLRRTGEYDSSAITVSLLRHLELTGATLLVEGIQNEADARWALSLGAAHGQGVHLGEPGPLSEAYPFPRSAVPIVTQGATERGAASPFDFVADLPRRRVDRANLNALGRMFAGSRHAPGASLAILACSGRDAETSSTLPDQFPGLAVDSPLRVVFGTGLPPEPRPGWRGVKVRPDDPLANQRFLVILGEDRTVAVLSEHDPQAPDLTSDVVWTQDPSRVYAIARHLIRRLPRTDGPNEAVSASAAGCETVQQPAEDADPHAEERHSGWWPRRRQG